MVTWFDTGSGGLLTVLYDAATRRYTGALAVAGRGDGGHVWLRDGHVVAARADGQPSTVAAVVAVGAADAATVAHVGRNREEAAPAAVAAVVEELTLEALDLLVALAEGSVRELADDQPSLDNCISIPVQHLAGALEGHRARRRVRGLARRGQWTLADPGADVTLSADEWSVLQTMARPVDATEAAAASGREFADVSTLLRGLLERGIVERTSGATGTPPAPRPSAAPSDQQRPPVRSAAPAAPQAPSQRSDTAPRPAAPSLATSAVRAGSTSSGQGSRASALRRLIGAVRSG